MNEGGKKIILKIKNNNFLKIRKNAESLGFKILLNEEEYKNNIKNIPSICSCGNLCNYILNCEKISDCYICNHGPCSYNEYKKYIELLGYKIDITEEQYSGKSKRYPGYCPENHKCSLLVYNLKKGKTSCVKCGRIKTKQTNIERYGTENPMQNKEIRQKTKQTNIERYGTENPMQNKEIKQKAKDTNKERYGFENPMQNKEIKQKAKDTNKEIYGFENATQNEGVKQKTRETNKERYGFEYIMQKEEIKQKAKDTNKEKYGFENATQNEEVKQKTRETNKEKYGFEYATQNEEVKQKTRETNKEKYGFEYTMQNEEVKRKSRETNKEKYGFEYTMQNEEVKRKSRETSIKRYGYEYPMQNQEISNKQRKNSYCVKDYILPSGKEVKIQGYEGFCLDELFEQKYKENELVLDIRFNENDINEIPEIWYEFEGKKSRYFPDIFIPKEKRIIEIKSEYYLNKNLDKNLLKAKRCIEMGYSFEFRIYNRKGELVEIINM